MSDRYKDSEYSDKACNTMNLILDLKNCSLSLSGELRFTGCDCLLMSVMRVTSCKLSLQPARSNAFDIHNSLVGNPIPDQGGFNTVPICNCNSWPNEAVFAFPSNPVINQKHELEPTR